MLPIEKANQELETFYNTTYQDSRKANENRWKDFKKSEYERTHQKDKAIWQTYNTILQQEMINEREGDKGTDCPFKQYLLFESDKDLEKYDLAPYVNWLNQDVTAKQQEILVQRHQNYDSKLIHETEPKVILKFIAEYKAKDKVYNELYQSIYDDKFISSEVKGEVKGANTFKTISIKRATVKKRTGEDRLTYLNNVQTPLLFHYLRKSKVILNDKNLQTATEIAKAICVMTGFSENTLRQGLSNAQTMNEINKDDLLVTQKKLQEIIRLIDKDLEGL